MTRRRLRIAAVSIAAATAACVLLVAALIVYHGVSEQAYDKCLLSPPWSDLPAEPVAFEVKWRWLPPDSTCVFTLPDGSKVERDWTEFPHEEAGIRD